MGEGEWCQVFTSAIIMWQSNVPRPCASVGRSTCPRILATTGAPNVMLGTKCPSLRACARAANVSRQSSNPNSNSNWGSSRRAPEDPKPYMMSTWSQSAPCSMVRAQSCPSCAKSADRIDGAMMVLGAMAVSIACFALLCSALLVFESAAG